MIKCEILKSINDKYSIRSFEDVYTLKFNYICSQPCGMLFSKKNHSLRLPRKMAEWPKESHLLLLRNEQTYIYTKRAKKRRRRPREFIGYLFFCHAESEREERRAAATRIRWKKGELSVNSILRNSWLVEREREREKGGRN